MLINNVWIYFGQTDRDVHNFLANLSPQDQVYEVTKYMQKSNQDILIHMQVEASRGVMNIIILSEKTHFKSESYLNIEQNIKF